MFCKKFGPRVLGLLHLFSREKICVPQKKGLLLEVGDGIRERKPWSKGGITKSNKLGGNEKLMMFLSM